MIRQSDQSSSHQIVAPNYFILLNCLLIIYKYSIPYINSFLCFSNLKIFETEIVISRWEIFQNSIYRHNSLGDQPVPWGIIAFRRRIGQCWRAAVSFSLQKTCIKPENLRFVVLMNGRRSKSSEQKVNSAWAPLGEKVMKPSGSAHLQFLKWTTRR